MKILNEVGKLLSPNDPEVVEKTLTRLNEQDTWNDVFSTKLIEVLDSIDTFRAETRSSLLAVERSRQEAVEVKSAIARSWRWLIAVIALSWALIAWSMWLSVRDYVSVMWPALITVLFFGIAALLIKRIKYES